MKHRGKSSKGIYIKVIGTFKCTNMILCKSQIIIPVIFLPSDTVGIFTCGF